MSLLDVALPQAALVVAVDPGKVMNRVWISDGSGLLVDPQSVAVSRDGMTGLDLLVSRYGLDHEPLVFAIEATGQPAPGVGQRVGASTSGHGPAVRPVGDQGRAHPAGVGAVQDRRPGLRRADLHGPAGRRAAVDLRGRGGHAARGGPPPPRPGGATAR